MGASVLLLGIAVISACIYGFVYSWQTRMLPRLISKTTAMVFLSLFTVISDVPLLMKVSIIAASVGDFTVLYGYRWDGMRRLYVSFTAFMVAYGLMLLVFIQAGAGLGSDFAYILAFAIAFAAMALTYYGPYLKQISSASVVFALMIVAHFSVAYTLPPEFILAWYGAALILLSEALFGYELFLVPEDSKTRRLSSPTIWLTYFGGQTLIVCAFVF